VFYCGTGTVSSLSDFKGKRLAIGSPGSGTRALALALLKLHKMEPGGNTEMVDSGAEESVKALLDDKVEAVFLTTDSASPRLMRQLLLNDEVQLVNFTQADAYARRVSYLNRLDLPMGALDFGLNIPKDNIRLVGPTVELLARKEADQDGPPLVRRVQHHRRATPVGRFDLGQVPAAHGAILTGLQSAEETPLDSPR